MAHEQLMKCCNMCNCWQVRVGTADNDMSVAMEAHALYCHFNQSDSSFNKGQALLDYMHQYKYTHPKYAKLQVESRACIVPHSELAGPLAGAVQFTCKLRLKARVVQNMFCSGSRCAKLC